MGDTSLPSFPSFLFPRSNLPNSSLYANNYGSVGAPNITVNHSGKVVSFSNKHVNPLKQSSKVYPLTKPQDHHGLPVFCNIRDFMIEPRPHGFQAQLTETTCHTQHYSFCNDYSDVVFETLFDINSNEKTPFCSQSKLDKTNRQIKKLLNSKQAQAFSRVKKAKLDPIPNFLTSIMNLDILNVDVPKDVILNYLDEELMNNYELELEDPNLGNTLAFGSLGTNDAVLLYASGPVGDKVNVISIKACIEDRESGICSIPKKQLLQAFNFKGPIREIKTFKYIWGFKTVAAIRTNYTLSLLSENESSNRFDVIQTIASTDEIVSFDLNPYLENDVVIALQDGSFCLYTDGALQQTSLPWKQPHTEDAWMRVLYSSCPRKFLAITRTQATLHDIRTSSAACRVLYKIPFENADREYFTPASNINPQNRHQYYLTTNRSLLIFDDRFLGEPISRHYHHMEGNPQFMDLITTSKNSSMIFLGSYAKRETRYVEISQYSNTNDFNVDNVLTLSSKDNALPPSCSEMLQLGNYHEWISEMLTNEYKCKQVEKVRLKRQLTGIAVSRGLGSDSDSNYLVVQRSICGDLYFQYLTSDKDHKTLSNQNAADAEFFENWIKEAYTDIVRSETELSKKYLSFVKTPIPNASLLTKNINDNATLCNTCRTLMNVISDKEIENEQTINNQNDDNLSEPCYSCGMDSLTYENMKKIYQKQGLITLSNIGMECNIDKSKEKVDMNSKDRLISKLQKNWLTNKYTPLMDDDENSNKNVENDTANTESTPPEATVEQIVQDAKSVPLSQPEVNVELHVSDIPLWQSTMVDQSKTYLFSNQNIASQLSVINDETLNQSYSTEPIEQYQTREEELLTQTQNIMSQGNWEPMYTSSQVSNVPQVKKPVLKQRHSMGF